MKKTLLLSVILMAFVFNMNAQEYKVITVVESIVPMGLGRSRIIEHQQASDYKPATADRTAESQGTKMGSIKRNDLKVDAFSETKLLNFYSGVGINFQNIASNDALITSKINTMINEGWKLTFVTSAVESDSGKDDGNGIFITRLFFTK